LPRSSPIVSDIVILASAVVVTAIIPSLFTPIAAGAKS
jgi:hypothetical protein